MAALLTLSYTETATTLTTRPSPVINTPAGAEETGLLLQWLDRPAPRKSRSGHVINTTASTSRLQVISDLAQPLSEVPQ